MEHVGREHLIAQLRDANDSQWIRFTWLENDGVTHRESGRDFAPGVNRRPVEGNDCSDDAERLQNRGPVDAAAVMKVATR